MSAARPGPFSLAVALSSFLLTLVVAEAVWESYYPPVEREALRRRKEYYEKVLSRADLSWREGLYYKSVGEVKRKR